MHSKSNPFFLKISTWNVNGIRACVRKGFDRWCDEDAGDIICLQETKITLEQIEELLPHLFDHKRYYTFFACAQKKGYSGVSIFSSRQLPLPKITVGLNDHSFDSEGRTLTAEYPNFNIICAYFPNGRRDLSRISYKLDYSNKILEWVDRLRRQTGKMIIVAGDFNTAHREIDLKNPRSNRGSTGFLPIEREWIDTFIKNDLVDVVRSKHPHLKDLYSWWTYRRNCRSRNIGWRIDYFFIDKKFFSRVRASYHGQEIMGSDHCPLYLELDANFKEDYKLLL